MVVLRQFWTPCYWYDDVNQALLPITIYTALFSVVMITYSCYVLDGGESSQFYMPYFEMNRGTSMTIFGVIVIIFMLVLFFASIAIVIAMKNEIRGLMIPWLGLIGLMLLYQLWLGLWWLYAYYIYLDTVLFVLIDFIWIAYHAYLWLAVYSMYQGIKLRQQPNFMLMYQ